MSYILQGSGSALGPCLSQLISRDLLAKFTPCICLKCSRLVSSSSVHDRGKSPVPSQSQSQSQNQSQNQSQSRSKFSQLGSVNRNPPVMRRDLCGSVRPNTTNYSSPIFRENQSTTYQVPGSPLTINLSVRVGPDLNTGVSYRLLHTSSLLEKKASSKLEETVIRLKEKQDDALAQISKVEDLEKKIASVIEQDDMVRYELWNLKYVNDQLVHTWELIREILHGSRVNIFKVPHF